MDSMVSLQIPKDVITGETIKMEKIGMNDGEYTWFNTLAYYIEKYNLLLLYLLLSQKLSSHTPECVTAMYFVYSVKQIGII